MYVCAFIPDCVCVVCVHYAKLLRPEHDITLSQVTHATESGLNITRNSITIGYFMECYQN